MRGFADIRKISFLKKPFNLSVSTGNKEAIPQEYTKQIGETEEQKPAQRPDKAIIQKKINLGFRPSSQVHP